MVRAPRLFRLLSIPLLAALASSAAADRSGRPELGVSTGPDAAGRTRAPDAGLLWDQTANPSGRAFVSSDFSDLDPFDCQGADDFVVPPGERWVVQGVNAWGSYSQGPGPADSVDVTFFADAGTLPGEPLCEYEGLVPLDTEGDFDIDLPAPCVLDADTQWVSVEAALAFAGAGQWNWEMEDAQVGAGAAWQNPGDGLLTGCTTWGRATDCLGSPPDFTFQLEGTTPLFSDDFEDGLDPSGWSFERGTWEESGGSLSGVPDDLIGDQIKARAIADPAFAGCDLCTVRAQLLATDAFGGVAEIHVRLLAWYAGRQDNFSVTLKPAQDKVVIRQKEGGVNLIREDIDFTLDEDLVYEVVVTFDGTDFQVSIDGGAFSHTQASLFPATPFGTVGVQSRNSDVQIHDALAFE